MLRMRHFQTDIKVIACIYWNAVLYRHDAKSFKHIVIQSSQHFDVSRVVRELGLKDVE